jgi:hypothetical protein
MKGTHGTTTERASSIVKEGFKYPTGEHSSRRGSGAYFWDYTTEDTRVDAFELAKAYWMSKYSKNHCPDTQMSIIDVSFNDDLVVLDASRHEPEFHKELCEFIRVSEDKFTKANGNLDFNEVSGMFDNFVLLIEKAWGKTIDALRVDFRVSDRKHYPPRYLLGVESPTCLVVKTTSKIVIGGVH